MDGRRDTPRLLRPLQHPGVLAGLAIALAYGAIFLFASRGAVGCHRTASFPFDVHDVGDRLEAISRFDTPGPGHRPENLAGTVRAVVITERGDWPIAVSEKVGCALRIDSMNVGSHTTTELQNAALTYIGASPYAAVLAPLRPGLPPRARIVWSGVALATCSCFAVLGFVFGFTTRAQYWIRRERLLDHACPNCRYDIRGLPDARRPECGQTL